MKKVKSILITDISSYKAIVVLRHIKRSYPNIKTIGCDHRIFTRNFHSKFIDVFVLLENSPANGIKYIKEIKKIVEYHNCSLLVPINSSETRLMLENKHLLNDVIDYFGKYSHFNLLDNKQLFHKLLVKLNLPHPKTYDSLNNNIPLVLKPAVSSASKGVKYITNKTELKKINNLFDKNKYIVQEYINGEGFGFSGFFVEGKIIIEHAHLRVAEYPHTGGSSVIREKYSYKDLYKVRKMVEKLLKEVPWSGFAMFEFKRTANGELFFIECNPRIWGSIGDGLHRNKNYFETLLGPSKKTSSSVPKKRTELFPLSYITLLNYLISGKINLVFNIIKNLNKSKFDVGPFSDISGFLSVVFRKK